LRKQVEKKTIIQPEGGYMNKKKERPQNKYLKPPFQKGHKGLPGAGRPKGKKAWATVFRDIFEMEHSDIKESTGIEIPKSLKKKDLQYFIAMRAIQKAMTGDERALRAIMDRMDGLPGQKVEILDDYTDVMPLEEIDPESRIDILKELINEAKEEIKNQKVKKRLAL
jgi:hypothetical protein